MSWFPSAMEKTSWAGWIKANKALLLAGLVLSATALYLVFDINYEQCDDADNCITIAFEVQDDYLYFGKENPQHLADKMSALTGMDVEIMAVSNSGAIIEAINNGNADIGFVDGAAAWLAWEVYDLDVLAAEWKFDQRTYYNAAAWVKKDSEIADALELTERDVQTLRVNSGSPYSLDSPVPGAEEGTLLEVLPNGDKSLDSGLQKESFSHDIEETFRVLNERERDVLKYYYGITMPKQHNFEEIGELLGITRERARQIKNTAIRKLQRSSKTRVLKQYLGS